MRNAQLRLQLHRGPQRSPRFRQLAAVERRLRARERKLLACSGSSAVSSAQLAARRCSCSCPRVDADGRPLCLPSSQPQREPTPLTTRASAIAAAAAAPPCSYSAPPLRPLLQLLRSSTSQPHLPPPVSSLQPPCGLHRPPLSAPSSVVDDLSAVRRASPERSGLLGAEATTGAAASSSSSSSSSPPLVLLVLQADRYDWSDIIRTAVSRGYARPKRDVGVVQTSWEHLQVGPLLQ